MAKEICPKWLPVMGYEGFYEVSSQGQVRAMGRYMIQERKGKKYLAYKKAKILRPHIEKGGYARVHLLGKNLLVHRLVAKAFGVIGEGNKVNHLDADATNNNYWNLEWCTQEENVRHTWELGRGNPKKADKNPAAKACWDEVNLIRSLHKKGIPMKDIVSEVSVGYGAVVNIVKGKTWVGK